MRRLVAILIIAAAGLSAPAVASAATPSLTGSSIVGSTLTLSPTAGATAESWETCTPAAVCTAVAPSGGTYTVAPSDDGNTIQVVETEADTTQQTSNAIGPITFAAPSVATAPALSSGSPQAGQPISVSNGAWSPSAASYSYAYQWLACNSSCAAIAGATGQTYTPTEAQALADDSLEAVVTATDDGGSAAAPTPASGGVLPVAIVPPPAPRVVTDPSIKGTAVQGSTLTAVPGGFAGGSAGETYQWQHCATSCTAIPGATGSTYRLTDADVGTQMAVTVTATNSSGSASSTSTRTEVVTGQSSTALIASPTSVGINQTVDLAAVVTSSADTADPAGTVTFMNAGVAIPGCSQQTVTGPGQSVTVTCATSFGLSTPTLTATFTPSASTPLSGSTSTTQAIAVSPDASVTTLDVPTTVTRRESVTYTATVMPADDLTGPVVPGGTVEFLNHGHPIHDCSAVSLVAGAATCTAGYRHTGTERISAVYAGTAGFGPSSAATRTVHVVRTLSAHGRRAAGSITATMQWTFHYTPSYTRVLALVLHGLPARSLVTVGCSGPGCPYASRTHKVTRAQKRMSIQGAFRRRRLRVRSRVVVTVTRSRYVGEYYRFTVQSRHPPAVLVSCLAPGSTRPGVGCKR